MIGVKIIKKKHYVYLYDWDKETEISLTEKTYKHIRRIFADFKQNYVFIEYEDDMIKIHSIFQNPQNDSLLFEDDPNEEDIVKYLI